MYAKKLTPKYIFERVNYLQFRGEGVLVIKLSKDCNVFISSMNLIM